MCNTIVHRYNNLTLAAEIQHQNTPVQLPVLAPTVCPCNLLAQGDSIKTWGIVLKWRCRTSYTKLPEILLPLLCLQTYCSLLPLPSLFLQIPSTLDNGLCLLLPAHTCGDSTGTWISLWRGQLLQRQHSERSCTQALGRLMEGVLETLCWMSLHACAHICKYHDHTESYFNSQVKSTNQMDMECSAA